MFPVAVARLELIVTICHVIVAMFPEAVARFILRERIFPVAVARLEFVVARLVFVVAILPVAVAIFVSWRVLVPWSFWIA